MGGGGEASLHPPPRSAPENQPISDNLNDTE